MQPPVKQSPCNDHHKGWRQVQAGIALIDWSKLASWNPETNRFTAANKDKFETSPSGHAQVHKKFERLICWIVFSVGVEYLVKGICILNNHLIEKKATLGSLSKRLKGLPKLGEKKDEVAESIGDLAKTIRSRDIHRYVENVRASDFDKVPDSVVPALNTLLETLNQDELRSQTASLSEREMPQ